MTELDLSAAEPTSWARRRRLSWGRAVPYALILPVLGVIGAILGYPLYNLIRLSFEKYGLFELIQHKGHWIGLHNFGSVLHDRVFWDTVFRTVVFTIAFIALNVNAQAAMTGVKDIQP